MKKFVSMQGAFFLFALCVFSCSALLPVFSMYSWHDHQRIAEIFLICVVCFLSFFCFRFFYFYNFWVVILFFLIGYVSSFYSVNFDWAMREWGRLFGLFMVVLFVARVCVVDYVVRSIFFILFLVGFFLSFQFLNYYLMAFFTGVRNFDSYFLLYGFDNPRFLGQFQAVLLPMLAVFLLQAYEAGRRRWAILVFVVLLVQWVMLWSMGGRGLLLGFFVSFLGLFFIGRRFSRLIYVQLFSAAIAYFLFLFLFEWLPWVLDFKVVGRDVLRYGLSGREAIWWGAIDMILEHPLLGVGPMHYSAVWNNIAAHPHQLLLLVFSEWGVPAGLLFCYLMFFYFKRGFLFLRAGAATDLDGGLWLVFVSSFVLGQVDGVLVMPYGEVWLVVIIGVAAFRWRNSDAYDGRGCFLIPFLIFVLLIFMCVLVFEAPSLISKEEMFFNENSIGSPPRFWGQGWIPM